MFDFLLCFDFCSFLHHVIFYLLYQVKKVLQNGQGCFQGRGTL
jgi:hypothetical protein